ncbi:hypothetical protein PENANT_c029G10425 [Penicillium antarcticum]|uniref:NB-ARC domain-containing protein n=1 Tax=Penicillium antarcticum TaxID=416450 RepID=A0A1V6PW42_9EURO|nr:hypothetical protein PENANT_c029G10425 [Penicillium antarcticum]
MQLEEILHAIWGEIGLDSTGKLNRPSKVLVSRDKPGELQMLRDNLSIEKQNLKVLLIGIGLYEHKASQDTFDQISADMRSLNRKLEAEIVTLESQLEIGIESYLDKYSQKLATIVRLKQFRTSVDSVANFVSVIRPNVFFNIPQPTYAEIATQVRLEPNHHAAMHWLSSCKERWLLIIDNADDLSIKLDDYFPERDRGNILITTRNPAQKVYGNLECGFFDFEGMDKEEATFLLLRSAMLPEPWDADTLASATKITEQLGRLVIAIIHAGATIRNGLCTLKDYLGFYDKDWGRIRRTRRPHHPSEYDEKYLSAYATFELVYCSLEQRRTESSEDAIQLLKMFSFLYFKKIRFDILRKAITNLQIEKAQQEEADQEKKSRPLAWNQRYNDLRLSILGFIAHNRGPPALPSFIREGRELGVLDEPRVRYALSELIQVSLITHHEANDSYSIHPLLHIWVRQRPGMSTSEQAVWSQAAATTLAHSILLPPLGDNEADELFRKDILPHVDHVRSCQEVVERKILENRKSRWPRLNDWPGTGSRFGQAQVVLYVKFSLVYAQNGRWEDAEELQLAAKRYTESVLGLNHSVTRRITLALVGTYWNQGRGDEAANLQDAVAKASIASLGPDNAEMLMTMDLLGRTRWQQGRYTEARVLHQQALDGLIRLHGTAHKDTLTAMCSLGQTLAKLCDLDEASRFLQEAFDGMCAILGPTHLNTLAAKEYLAMVILKIGEKSQFLTILEMMQQIFECRTKKLGKEHPHTLHAMVNLARVKTALGQHSQAEALVRQGLQIADRNLSKNHTWTLMGRGILANILTCESKLSEAEDILVDVIEQQRYLSSYWGDFHPDRLHAMAELAHCYRLQNRYDEGIRMCDETIDGLQMISMKQHPLERKIKAQRIEMMEMKRREKDPRKQQIE